MSSNSCQLLCSVQLHYINSRLNRILSQGDSHSPVPPRAPPALTLATLCESTKLRLRVGQHTDITQRGIRRVWQHFLFMIILNFETFTRHLFLKSFLQHAWTFVHADMSYMRYTVENYKQIYNHVCMYVYIYMCVCVCVCVYVCVCVCVCVSIICLLHKQDNKYIYR